MRATIAEQRRAAGLWTSTELIMEFQLRSGELTYLCKYGVLRSEVKAQGPGHSRKFSRADRLDLLLALALLRQHVHVDRIALVTRLLRLVLEERPELLHAQFEYRPPNAVSRLTLCVHDGKVLTLAQGEVLAAIVDLEAAEGYLKASYVKRHPKAPRRPGWFRIYAADQDALPKDAPARFELKAGMNPPEYFASALTVEVGPLVLLAYRPETT